MTDFWQKSVLLNLHLSSRNLATLVFVQQGAPHNKECITPSHLQPKSSLRTCWSCAALGSALVHPIQYPPTCLRQSIKAARWSPGAAAGPRLTASPPAEYELAFRRIKAINQESFVSADTFRLHNGLYQAARSGSRYRRGGIQMARSTLQHFIFRLQTVRSLWCSVGINRSAATFREKTKGGKQTVNVNISQHRSSLPPNLAS